MTYNKNILERVRKKQIKEGVKYPLKDGKLYNGFKFFYIAGFAFANVFNFMYIIGLLLYIIEDERFAKETGNLIAVSVCTVLMIAALVISKFNDKPIFACIFAGLNCVSTSTLCVMFKQMLPDDTVQFGISIDYYWRHLAPLMIVLICTLGMSFIVINAHLKTKKAYNKVLEGVYEKYNELPDDNKPEWEEYIANFEF